MTYSEKLRDPRWQKRRLEILNRDGWACQFCGDKTNTLHVHHYFYHAGMEPWESTELDLVTLCESCHDYAEDVAHTAAPANCFEIIKTGRVFYFSNVFTEDELTQHKQRLLILFIETLRTADLPQIQALARGVMPVIEAGHPKSSRPASDVEAAKLFAEMRQNIKL